MNLKKYKYLSCITLMSLFIKLCSADCDEDYLIARDKYDDCMQNSNIHSMLTKSDLRMRDMCRLFYIAENCTENADNFLKNCNSFVKGQVANHLSGLKAFRKFECIGKGLAEEQTEEVTKCEIRRRKQLNACDKKLNYTYTRFLPLPVMRMRFTDDLWTEKDCRDKLKWADCWIKTYDKCEKKTAKMHYGNLFLTILRSYPNCERTLGQELRDYKISGATNDSTTFSYLILSLLITLIEL